MSRKLRLCLLSFVLRRVPHSVRGLEGANWSPKPKVRSLQKSLRPSDLVLKVLMSRRACCVQAPGLQRLDIQGVSLVSKQERLKGLLRKLRGISSCRHQLSPGVLPFSTRFREASAPRDFALYTARRREAPEGSGKKPQGPPGRAFCFFGKVLPPTPEHSGHLDRTLGTDQARLPPSCRQQKPLRALFARRGCATPGRRESPRPGPIQPRPSGEAPSASPESWSPVGVGKVSLAEGDEAESHPPIHAVTAETLRSTDKGESWTPCCRPTSSA